MNDEPTYQMEALCYMRHTRHHMQIALAQELKSVPNSAVMVAILPMSRLGTLLREDTQRVGLYQNPYSDFGR